MATKEDLSTIKNYKFNFITNVFDGAFFGFALGFASFSTIIPLFVSHLSNSAILIGLIPAIHSMGWQLPQILTARRVSAMKRLKPFVMLMTIQERLPFLGLGILALFYTKLHPTLTLIITFTLLIWQGLGAGMTANAWQILIGKVIPAVNRGTFFGAQSAAANLLSSFGAIAAGFILQDNSVSAGFALCFFIAFVFMIISWYFLNRTREVETVSPIEASDQPSLWIHVKEILTNDRPFVGFLLSRFLFQLGMMSFAFYIIYAVRKFNLSTSDAGIMTAILMVTMVVANPILGWIVDHWTHRRVFELGAVAAALSSVVILFAKDPILFYLVMVLDGIAGTAFWTIGIAYSLEFGTDSNRPTYVGIVNTSGAPIAIIAPILGGWLADRFNYSVTFIVSIIFALITAIVLHFFVVSKSEKNND
jgi:MFS family permease